MEPTLSQKHSVQSETQIPKRTSRTLPIEDHTTRTSDVAASILPNSGHASMSVANGVHLQPADESTKESSSLKNTQTHIEEIKTMNNKNSFFNICATAARTVSHFFTTIGSQTMKYLTKNEFSLSDDPTSFKVATSNVGLDAGISHVAKVIKKDDDANDYIEYHFKNLNDITADKSKLNNALDLLPKDINSLVIHTDTIRNELAVFDAKQLESFFKDFESFRSNINSLKTYDSNTPFTEVLSDKKAILSELVKFLESTNNCKILSLILKDEGVNVMPELNKLNQSIFHLYNFSKIQDSHQKKGISLTEYINQQEDKIIAKRIEQIKQNDVCFLQEYDKTENKFSKTLNKSLNSAKIAIFATLPEEPSLMINTERFEIQEIPGKRENNVLVPGQQHIKVKITNTNNKEISKEIKVFEDNSFGTKQFKAVIVKDIHTGKKMILCSVHIGGYDIGDKVERERAERSIRDIQKIIEKIAADNEVEGIVIGGDFNSVEERVGVGDTSSPLDPLRVAHYSLVKSSKNTEASPPGFLGTSPILRRIDHIFYLAVGEDAQAKATEGKVNEKLGSVRDQHKKAFDHVTLGSVSIKFINRKKKNTQEDEAKIEAPK